MSNVSVRDEWEARFGRRDPKVICVGPSDDVRAGEAGEPPSAPLLFGTYANALGGHGDASVLPDGIGHVAAEAEPVSQRVNGEPLQDAGTSSLIFPIRELIAYGPRAPTRERGDLILTGTPERVGYFREPRLPLRDGDVTDVEVEGVGVLGNPVVAA